MENYLNSAVFDGLFACTARFKSPQELLKGIQIWALTRIFQNPPFLPFEPFLGGFTCMFGIIILLEGPLLQLQLFDRWSQILLKHSLVWNRIHSRLYNYRLPRPWGSKAAPNHNISTTMLYSWYEVLLIKCCLWFFTKHSLCYCVQTALSLTWLSVTHCSRNPDPCLDIH